METSTVYSRLYRGLWQDRHVAALDAEGKLLFVYLFANTHVQRCGAYRLSTRYMAFETGLPEERIAALLPGMAPLVLWWPEEECVFVPKFTRYQYGDDDNGFALPRGNVLKSILRTVAPLPPVVRAAVVAEYPEMDADPDAVPTSRGKDLLGSSKVEKESIKTLPRPLKDPIKAPIDPAKTLDSQRPETNDQRPETTPIPKTRATLPAPVVMAMRADFNAFMEAYPEERKTDPVAAWNAWQQVASAGEITSIEDVLAGLATYKKTDEYQRGVILGAPKFILQKRWKKPGAAAAPKIGRTFGGDAPNLPGRPAI